MSEGSSIVRIGRKGLKKFAFGDPDPSDPNKGVFEVDVVVAFQKWLIIDDECRPVPSEPNGDRSIPHAGMPTYNAAAQAYVSELSGTEVTVAEAFDFLARLREEYDRLATFFRPKSSEEPKQPDTSAPLLQFVEEPAA